MTDAREMAERLNERGVQAGWVTEGPTISLGDRVVLTQQDAEALCALALRARAWKKEWDGPAIRSLAYHVALRKMGDSVDECIRLGILPK